MNYNKETLIFKEIFNNAEELFNKTIFNNTSSQTCTRPEVKSEIDELLAKYNDLKQYITAVEQENIRLKEELELVKIAVDSGQLQPIKYTLSKVIDILQMLLNRI